MSSISVQQLDIWSRLSVTQAVSPHWMWTTAMTNRKWGRSNVTEQAATPSETRLVSQSDTSTRGRRRRRRKMTRWFTDLTVSQTHWFLTDRPTNVPAPGGHEIFWRIKTKNWSRWSFSNIRADLYIQRPTFTEELCWCSGLWGCFSAKLNPTDLLLTPLRPDCPRDRNQQPPRSSAP